MGDSVSSGKRHYGIDALRILSMFMIVSLHILGKGGVLENTVLFSKQYHAAWFLETAAFSQSIVLRCAAVLSAYSPNSVIPELCFFGYRSYFIR